MEIWKDVVGYEGIYEVSNQGRVRNIKTGHILSPGMSQGYFYVALYKDSVRSNKQINRLVAEAFIDNPDNHPLAHHKDEVKTNNVVDNLEWRDYSYNNCYGEGAAKRSESLRGKTAWNKGKKMSDGFGKKVSEGRKRLFRERRGE